MDDELMSTRIVSSKEGHDESQIDDMKFGTWFWNDVNVVTIWLTQRYWHKGCVYYRGKNSSDPLWTSGSMTKWLGSMTRQDKYTMRQWTMHSFERLIGLTWIMKVDRHGDQLNTQLTDMLVQTSAMFKGNDKQLPLFAKWFPFPFSPSWSMSASFRFYEFKEGNKHSI